MHFLNYPDDGDQGAKQNRRFAHSIAEQKRRDAIRVCITTLGTNHWKGMVEVWKIHLKKCARGKNYKYKIKKLEPARTASWTRKFCATSRRGKNISKWKFFKTFPMVHLLVFISASFLVMTYCKNFVIRKRTSTIQLETWSSFSLWYIMYSYFEIWYYHLQIKKKKIDIPGS